MKLLENLKCILTRYFVLVFFQMLEMNPLTCGIVSLTSHKKSLALNEKV